MTKIPSLAKIKKYFPIHRICLVINFLNLLGCILRCGSVNLMTCAKTAPLVLNDKMLKVSNIYTRFIRFFKQKNTSVFCLGIAYIILESLNDIQSQTYLIIDRTNWKLGSVNINILQIGITLPNGYMVPIFGVPLNKRGNSNETERISLLNLLIKLLPILNKESIVLGDREFIGKKWIKSILANELSFVLRLRKKDYLADLAATNKTTIEKLLRKINRKIRRDGFFFAPIEINNETLFFLATKEIKKGGISKDKNVHLLSNLCDIGLIIKAYRHRWQIEVYFACTKKKGFNLEDINLPDLDKTMLMAAIVGYAYTLSLIQGMIVEKVRPEKMQYFVNRKKKYRRKSIFNSGLEEIKKVIFNITDLIRFIKKNINKSNHFKRHVIDQFIGKSIFKELKSI